MAAPRVAIITLDDSGIESIVEIRCYDLSRGRVKKLRNGLDAARPIETTRPELNSTIQTLNGPVLTIEPDRVTEVFDVRNRTSEEIKNALPTVNRPEFQRLDSKVNSVAGLRYAINEMREALRGD